MPELKFIGEKVARARKEAGLTQQQLAEAAGLSLRFVAYVEADKKGVSANSLEQIAGAVGKDLNWFSDRQPDRVVEGPPVSQLDRIERKLDMLLRRIKKPRRKTGARVAIVSDAAPFSGSKPAKRSSGESSGEGR